MSAGAQRRRLPNRRLAVTETINVNGHALQATIGFDPATGAPQELFLSGAKDGTHLAAILADTAVILSVAMQCGIPASALGRSVARLPGVPVEPATAASIIGAALDLIAQWECDAA